MTTTQPLMGETLASWIRRQNCFEAAYRAGLMRQLEFVSNNRSAAEYSLVSSNYKILKAYNCIITNAPFSMLPKSSWYAAAFLSSWESLTKCTLWLNSNESRFS